MKLALRTLYFIAFVFISLSINAQRVKLNGALGASAYYGDLMQGTPLLKQMSFAFTGGGSYDFNNKLRGRLSFSLMKVKADDNDNSDQKFRDRNLNFKSNIWDLNVAAEYDFLDNVEEYSYTPYIFFGPGIFHFNPTTIDRNGNKVFLRDWGTEGQGSLAYPDRKKYNLTQFCLGYGAGVRMDINDDLQIGAELFIRKTFTDYIDDVSLNSYVPPTAFANPYSALLSFRGDEVGKTFSTTMPRGNPKHKDLFYTLQLRLTYRLENIRWGNRDNNWGGYGFKVKRGLRNPKGVL